MPYAGAASGGGRNSAISRKISANKFLGMATSAFGIVTTNRACGFADGSVAKRMNKISYKGYRFPPEIIQEAIWLYLRFTLSFRDVEDLLAERGIVVSYKTVRRWMNYFGPMIAAKLRKRVVSPWCGRPHVGTGDYHSRNRRGQDGDWYCRPGARPIRPLVRLRSYSDTLLRESPSRHRIDDSSRGPGCAGPFALCRYRRPCNGRARERA
jgi:hypothetical protein